MPGETHSCRWVRAQRHYAIFTLAPIFFLSACVPVPVRMPVDIRGPVGVSTDTSFIIPQQTTTDEVVRKLGWADVGLQDKRLFWGRREPSKKGRALIGFVPQGFPPIGEYDRWRIWEAYNILVEFDEYGVVTSAREVKDKNVMGELISWTQAAGRDLPDFPVIAQKAFSAGYRYDRRTNSAPWWGKMSVEQEGLEFTGSEYSQSIYSGPR